ncbi:MAG: GHKL domain-containing protein [Streptococcus hyointestinalis]|uniref:sensor histidine kinase n=1 Tax=Streptococcus hyointestinalis TaxID=1337 RepID=UPI0023F33C4A|nr:GHKL domain-containing protein [Streptococcus hyointestinalis]MDD7355552.1 GHKL domain-containing protein [Streptococcus hyointestinalis]MDY4552859.1 GHKL domain-containing protein [Streptococcus hyointestinalis]
MSFNYLMQILFIYPFILLVHHQISDISFKWYEYFVIVSVFVLTDFSSFYYFFLEFTVLILFSYIKDRTKPMALHLFYGMYPWVMEGVLRRFVAFYVLPVFTITDPGLFSENIFVIILTEFLVYFIYFVATYQIRFDFQSLSDWVSTQTLRRRLFVIDIGMLVYFIAIEFFTGAEYYGHVNTLMIRQLLTIFYFIVFIGSLIYLNSAYKKHLEEELVKVRLSELDTLLTYTKQIEELYTEIRAFRHDYANILTTINEGIIHNDMDIIKKVYQSVLKESNDILESSKYDFEGLAYIKDDALKSIIATKIFDAKKRGIDVRLDIPDTIDKPDNMALLDVIRLISILVDNAVEAALKAECPQVTINLHEDDGNYIITISNSTKEERIPIAYLSGDGYTSKKNGDHGIGLTTIKRFKDKYPNLNVEAVNNRYLVEQRVTIEKNN